MAWAIGKDEKGVIKARSVSTSEDMTEQRFPEFAAGGRSRCRFADVWEREVAAASVGADRGTGVGADS